MPAAYYSARMPRLERSNRHPLLSGVTATSLGTLASRVTGVLRETATAALLGMSKDGIMDAYVVAFRIPNLFRRLFGEGAMTASYLPVLTADLETDRKAAWKLVSAAAVALSVVLLGVTIVAEGICWLMWAAWGDQPGMRLVLGLTATMLPYTVLICVAALVTATLQALGEFRLPAMVPSVMNVCWLACAWLIAPRVTSDPHGQAFVMAGCVLVGGLLQLLVQLPKLRTCGFRFALDYRGSRQALIRIARGMAPTTLGLAITQINTLVDSLLARGLSSTPGGPATIGWLGGIAYPLRQGAAAAVWYAERVYQFPVGLLGIAVATVIFPLLSRHAAQGRHDRVSSDLTFGLRLVLLGGIPAAAGLYVLAEPITRLLFERHNFTSADTPRAAAMVAWYAVGVWAFCAVPVLVRAFYAVGDRTTPLRVGLVCVAVNLTLNVTLIWPLAETALALATSISAILQVSLLAVLFSRSHCGLEWPLLGATALRSGVSSLAMSVVAVAVLLAIPKTPAATNAWLRVVLPLAAAMATYFATFAMIGQRELAALFGRNRDDAEPSPSYQSPAMPGRHGTTRNNALR